MELKFSFAQDNSNLFQWSAIFDIYTDGVSMVTWEGNPCLTLKSYMAPNNLISFHYILIIWLSDGIQDR